MPYLPTAARRPVAHFAKPPAMDMSPARASQWEAPLSVWADGMEMSEAAPALTGKAKKRAEMEGKRLHKVQVSSLKKGK